MMWNKKIENTDENKEIIRNKIRAFVMSYGSARNFCEATGLPYSTVSKWISGYRYPGRIMSKRLALISKGDLKESEICIHDY